MMSGGGNATSPGTSPPRYMQASPPRDNHLAGQPPVPPPAVARSIRKPAAQAPGDWDWQKLGHNYRTTWTTLHGGAYANGKNLHARTA